VAADATCKTWPSTARESSLQVTLEVKIVSASINALLTAKQYFAHGPSNSGKGSL
jgi:hypothetical protein